MSSLKLIKRRISSIRSTQQITRVMKMVAAAKLKRSQENIVKARPYSLKLRQVIREVSHRIDRSHHPLLEIHPPEKIGIVVVTGDRGLCGSFNTNILKAAQLLIDEHSEQEIRLITVGRKGTEFFTRRGFQISGKLLNFFNHLEYAHAADLGNMIVNQYIEHGMDRVYLVYNEFKSAIQQNVITEQLLPIMPDPADEHVPATDIIYEPSELEILNAILPRYVNVQMWRVLLESFAAEMGARMTAMENATKNAGELISSLTLTYNKVRQASITNEILEVVAGAEGLQ
jgi:F-type H+-transporting ATPase subunit gamma